MSAWEWIQRMVRCWKEKDIDGLQPLIADPILYYENPFSGPLTSWEEIRKEWEEIKEQDIAELSTGLLVADKQKCVASYSLTLNLKDGSQYSSRGAFFVALNEQGRAVQFRQWWNERKYISHT